MQTLTKGYPSQSDLDRHYDKSTFLRYNRHELPMFTWQSYVCEVFHGQRERTRSESSWVVRDVGEKQEEKMGETMAQI